MNADQLEFDFSNVLDALPEEPPTQPGLIEVTYGERPGGRAYAYRCGFPVAVGDVVEVPPTFICPEPQAAVVVSLTSNYSGKAASVIRILCKGKR